MSFEFLLSMAAGAFFLGAFVPYIRAIKRGECHPKRATWIIWGTLDLILLVGMIVEGTVNTIIIGACMGVGIVIYLSFKHGESGWDWIDKSCLGGAALGLALWAIMRDPAW